MWSVRSCFFFFFFLHSSANWDLLPALPRVPVSLIYCWTFSLRLQWRACAVMGITFDYSYARGWPVERKKVSYACQILLATRHSLYIEHRMVRWDEGGVRNTEQKVVKGWQEGCGSVPSKGRWRWACKLRQVNDTSVSVCRIRQQKKKHVCLPRSQSPNPD